MAARTSKELLDQPSFPDSLLICGKRPPLSSRGKKGGPATASEAKPHTAAVPPSQVLSKVKGFLGLIAEANDKLELAVREGSRGDYNVEVLDGNEEYIEMNLLLGIADLHSAEAVAAAETAMSSHRELPPPPSVNCGCSDSDSGSDDEEDEPRSSKKHSAKGCESVRRGKRNKRPKIVVLNSSSE